MRGYELNKDWLNGKHPALGDALEESRQMSRKNKANDKTSVFGGAADCCCGWGLYWFAVLFLTFTLSDGFFVLGFFGGIIKWIGQRRKNAIQDQADKLYGKMQGESSSPSDRVRDWGNDTINNPLYFNLLGNTAHTDEDNFPKHQC